MSLGQYLKIYLDGTINEIAIDSCCLKLVDLEHLSYVPIRPFKTATLVKKLRFIFPIIYFFLTCFFIPLFPILSLVSILNVLRKKGGNSFQGDKAILGFSPRVWEVMKHVEEDYPKEFIFTGQVNSKNEQISSVNLYQHFNLGLAMKLWCLSFIIPFAILFRTKSFFNILQAFTFPSFLTVIASLIPIKDQLNEVWMVNHYDRWAVLVDRLFAGNKIVLAQHGLLSYNNQPEILLENITHLYTYSDYSKKQFFDFVLSKKCKPEIGFFNIKLNLTPIDVEASSILIIGQPQSMDKEVAILEHLLTYEQVGKVFLKPHPLFPMDKYERVKDERYALIKDKTFFPKVDFAIANSSTLGSEYEMAKIKVIWHENKSLEDLEQVFQQEIAE